MMGGFLPEGWRPHRSPRDPSIVLDDGTAQPPERPADAHPAAGQWEPPHDAPEAASGGPVSVAEAVREVVPYMDQMRTAHRANIAEAFGVPYPNGMTVHDLWGDAPEPDPGAANRTSDFPEAPDYRQIELRARGAVARIDDAIEENLRETNQRLRRDLRAEIDHRRTVEHERDAALARVAELTLTLQALGRVVVHAAGHDEKET